MSPQVTRKCIIFNSIFLFVHFNFGLVSKFFIGHWKTEVERAIRLGLKLLPRSGTLPGSTNSIETSLGFRIDSLKRTNFVRGKWFISTQFIPLVVVPYLPFFFVPAKLASSRFSVCFYLFFPAKKMPLTVPTENYIHNEVVEAMKQWTELLPL